MKWEIEGSDLKEGDLREGRDLERNEVEWKEARAMDAIVAALPLRLSVDCRRGKDSDENIVIKSKQ